METCWFFLMFFPEYGFLLAFAACVCMDSKWSFIGGFTITILMISDHTKTYVTEIDLVFPLLSCRSNLNFYFSMATHRNVGAFCEHVSSFDRTKVYTDRFSNQWKTYLEIKMIVLLLGIVEHQADISEI